MQTRVKLSEDFVLDICQMDAIQDCLVQLLLSKVDKVLLWDKKDLVWKLCRLKIKFKK